MISSDRRTHRTLWKHKVSNLDLRQWGRLLKGGIDVRTVFVIRCNFTRVNWLGKAGKFVLSQWFSDFIYISESLERLVQTQIDASHTLKEFLILMVLSGVQEFVFPRSLQVMLILCWRTLFERTIVLGRSSSICKSRELKTWCIQKMLSMGLAWGPVVKTPHFHCPRLGVLSLVKELRIFMPYGAAKKPPKDNLSKFQCEDVVRDKAGEEK